MIDVEGLRFAYPGATRPAVDGLDFSVAPGEAAAIELARGLAARGDLVVVAPWTER